MLLRDVTLQVILFRYHLPTELRYIICQYYFPFFPTVINPLRSYTLLDFAAEPHDGIYIHIARSHYIPDYESKIPFMCFVLEIEKYCDMVEITVARGTMTMGPWSSDVWFTRPIKNDKMPPGFYNLKIPVNKITVETVDEQRNFILQWYYKRILHCIDNP